MCRKFLIISFVLIFFVQLLIAQYVTKVGTTAAKFLGVPVGARATAMGTAFVAMANDATATFWNPGGLNQLQNPEVYFSHSEWFGELSFDCGSFVYPLGVNSANGTMGLSYTSLTMPNERVTSVDDPEGEFSGTFDAGSYAIGISYNKSLTDRFAIGGTAKYIVETIYNSSAHGVAIDIGTFYTTPFKGIRLGVIIANFGQKMRIEGEDLIVQKDIDQSISGNNESVNALLMTDQFDLPLMMRIGLAWDPIKNDFIRLSILADAMHPNDNMESLNIGTEYAVLNESFLIRAGYKNFFLKNNEGRFTAGIGVQLKSHFSTIKFDYAFSEYRYLQDVHIFSLGLGF